MGHVTEEVSRIANDFVAWLALYMAAGMVSKEVSK
jgi:hypothetical protein